MKARLRPTRWCPLLVVVGVLAGSSCLSAATLGTGFTYQGRLKNAGSPASGLYDLRFRLYELSADGPQIGATLCLNDVTVAGGLFTVTLDFGPQFNGEDRFLEIDVRADTGLDCTNTTGFTTLAPRQPLNGTPYAQFALDADRLDGFSSDNFLFNQVPLIITGAPADGVVEVTNTSAAAGTFGVHGASQAAAGGGLIGSVGGGLLFSLPAGVVGSNTLMSGSGVVGRAGNSFGPTNGGHFTSSSDSGTGVRGSATASSGQTFGGFFQSNSSIGRAGGFRNTGLDSAFDVDLAGPNGAIDTGGFLHRQYTGSTRSAAIPIAYGSISATGAINSGTGNFTVSPAATGQYDITIAGETYSNNAFTVTITPVTNSPRITGVADAGAGFRVNMWNLAGTLVDNAFHFTVWTADPSNPG